MSRRPDIWLQATFDPPPPWTSPNARFFRQAVTDRFLPLQEAQQPGLRRPVAGRDAPDAAESRF